MFRIKAWYLFFKSPGVPNRSVCCLEWKKKKKQRAVDVALFSAIFQFIVLRLLTRAISNLALQAIEKVPEMSRNSARWGYKFAYIWLSKVFGEELHASPHIKHTPILSYPYLYIHICNVFFIYWYVGYHEVLTGLWYSTVCLINLPNYITFVTPAHINLELPKANEEPPGGSVTK